MICHRKLPVVPISVNGQAHCPTLCNDWCPYFTYTQLRNIGLCLLISIPALLHG